MASRTIVFLLVTLAGLHAEQAADGDKPPCPVTNDSITSTDQGIPRVLACEWLNVAGEGPERALKALGLLTDSTQDVRDNYLKAFAELRAGLLPLLPGFDDLFDAAQGVPDNADPPLGQGYAAILKALAEANTRKKPPNLTDSAYESLLIDGAQKEIQKIYAGHKAGIGRVNGLFANSNPNRALYELLTLYPTCAKGATYQQCRSDYAAALESIRAAYQASVDDLAKAVAGFVHGQTTK